MKQELIAELDVIQANQAARAQKEPMALTESLPVQVTLITIALLFLLGFLFLPLLQIFVSAFRDGVGVFWQALIEEETRNAIGLTLLTAALTVPINTVFGVAAAWTITRFNFRGKSILLSLIDLPFAVSPVVAGLLFVLLFGAHGIFGPWLQAYDVKIIFAIPGIVLATAFVTFPFVARELIPIMEESSREEEEAAMILGANGWQMFYHITIPNVKWGLIYGVILCNARAMGEFGAVSVVSGHIRGKTNTIPLHVEILYNEYNFAAAFAVATLLAMLALLTLFVKQWVDWQTHKREHAPLPVAETP